MAITQGDLDKAKNEMITAQSARDAEWNGAASNPTHYSITAIMAELQKCNTNAFVTRDSEGNIINSYMGPDKHNCSKATWDQRVGWFNTAKGTYDTLQGTYVVKKADYDKLLADFIAQAPANAASATTKNKNVKTVAIVAGIVVALIVVYIIGVKYKVVPAIPRLGII